MKAFIFFLMLLSCSIALASSHHPQEIIKKAQKNEPGKIIYGHFCANCHNKRPKISLGAPRFRLKEDWQQRLEQPRDDLLVHLYEGRGLMPARGGCFECSDKDLLQALEYMLPKKNNIS